MADEKPVTRLEAVVQRRRQIAVVPSPPEACEGPPPVPPAPEGKPEPADTWEAVLAEALSYFREALASPGVQDTDARYLIGAMSAQAMLLDGLVRTLDEIIRQGVQGLYSPQERQALRAELVRVVQGGLPGPAEQQAAAENITNGVVAKLAPLLPIATGMADLRGAASAGARLAVAERLTPNAVLAATRPLVLLVSGAIAAGAVIGATAISLLR